MRIHRLDLLRYGRFTDAPLELSAHTPDLHIVFGANEAGKSTALSAIEDLLFGFPQNSPLNFLHDYGSMRIGAVLQNDGETLEVRRRKGTKDTLLTPDETPIPTGDRALTPFLGGADRSFFARMFSLDHERMRQGGREILEAQDEVGQMLFAASAGIAGLRDRLKEMDAEADDLWASRRAGRRKYYQAEERLKTAESALREHTVTASKWHELRQAYDNTREAYDSLEREIEEKAAELRKLSRIRRVYRDVRRQAELDAGIAALGEVPPLAEDARRSLEAAEQENTTAKARIETLTDQLEAARKERVALNYDEPLLARAEDIKQLQERRIQVRAEKASLPNRRAELASAEARLWRLAGELEWEAGDIGQLVARIPPRSKVAAVRALLNRRGGQISAVESGAAALEESEARVSDLRQQLDGMGAPVDVSKLAAIIDATREVGDIASRISGAESEVQDAQAAIQRHLRLLKPQVTDAETLAATPVPPRDTVQAHRDARRHLDERLSSFGERIRTAEQELAKHQKAHKRVTHDEDAVASEELAGAREQRDATWSVVRRRYVEGVSVSEEEVRVFSGTHSDLAAAYESAVREADAMADRRFDKAEAAARLAVISRQIAEQEELLQGLRGEESALGEESQAMDSAWREMWREAPFEPLSPDAMLQWIAARGEVLDGAERRAAAERRGATLRGDESKAKIPLLAELETLGVDSGPVKDEPLRVVLEACAGVQRRHEKNAETRRHLDEGLRKAAADSGRKRKALDKAEREWSEWENHWTDALSALGLGAAADPEGVGAQVDAIDEMREIAVKVNDLRHERIGKIERDVTAFGGDVAEIVGAIAADLAEAEPEDAVLELERRLDEARRIRELRKGKDEAIASFEEKIKECEESRRDARDTIGHLQEIANVETIDQLRIAIEKSDSLRGLQTELARVTKTLTEEGDSLPVPELRDECAAADLDQIAAREEALGHELTERRDGLMQARENRTAARREFEAIGGDDAAAKDAAARQEALAEIQHVAEQYVRVRSSALLLRWAVDRYRRDKQAPLLKRAGQLFASLTGDSFRALRVDFDEQDKVRLTGVRPDGAAVGVNGMSTGTADQLYLALRIASVEDYLDRAAPLPFVADDLFINFDDERAAAGFRVLGQLAARTQVLFFTHHRHLVDIARASLDAAVPVVALLDGSIT
jgi:uncharacterized protein YhaN